MALEDRDECGFVNVPRVSLRGARCGVPFIPAQPDCQSIFSSLEIDVDSGEAQATENSVCSK